MKMNLKTIISLLSFFVGITYARDSFFNTGNGYVERPELFELTDFKMPKIIINLDDNDYKNYFLRYQCEIDMNMRNLTRNEDCYTAPWVNLDDALEKAFKNDLIKKSKVSQSDLNIINKKNITLNQFEHIVTTYSTFKLEEILSTGYGLIKLPDYEAENAGLTFDLNGNKTEIKKIKFSVGGKYTKNFEKLGFNIKIKKGLLFGRKQLRLRSEAVDPSFLREKLAYDICNLVQLPSLSINYANVYFNDKFMGLYAMRDAFKASWVEFIFGEKDTTNLYTCDRSYGNNKYFNCKNDDDEIVEDVDLDNFLKRMENAKSRKEIEQFFDVVTFMRWQALKYLFGSWDHVTNAHNSYLYMYHDTTRNRDMWIPLLYDFDSEFGAYKGAIPRRRFNQEIYDSNNPIFDILNIKDSNAEIIKYMSEIMKKAFNPAILLPRIDQLKKFLGPYIKADRTPDEKTKRLPGRVRRLNIKIEDYFTYDDFIDNADYIKVKLRKYLSDNYYTDDYILGLKYWIIERFNYACETYGIDCSYASRYLGKFNYPTREIQYYENNGGCHNTGYNCCINKKAKIASTDAVGHWGYENGEWCLLELGPFTSDKCWSTSYGYPCCKQRGTKVAHTEPTGEQFGIENNAWCGITEFQLCPSGGEYMCCSGCEVILTDTQYWGFEKGKWCSIPYSCGLDEIKKTTKKTTTTTTTTTTVPSPTTYEGYTPYVMENGNVIYINQQGQQGNFPPPPYYGGQQGYYNQTTTVQGCGAANDRCGGYGYPSCCVQGYHCAVGQYGFLQCLPLNNTNTRTVTITTISNKSTTTTTKKQTTTTTTTTTTKKSTTTTTTTTTKASQQTSSNKCAAVNEPCGGTEYPNAPSCCQEGSFCFKYFTHIHQCLANDMKNYVPTGTNVITPDNSRGCATPYQACGGLNNMNTPSCCTSGYVCQRRNPSYHQCIPKAAYEQQQSRLSS